MPDYSEVFSDEELDKINGVVTRFYQQNAVSREDFHDTSNRIIKAALNQLYGEQAARKQYIINESVETFNNDFIAEEYIEQLNSIKLDEKILTKIQAVQGATIKDIEMNSELLQQVEAFILVNKQLINYFVSEVAASISGIVKKIINLSTEDVQKIESTTEFITQLPKTEMRLSQLTLPNSTIEILNTLGFTNELTRATTLGERLKLIAQIRTIIFVVNQLRESGISDHKAILQTSALCIYKTQT